jgi:hypothetical protein
MEIHKDERLDIATPCMIVTCTHMARLYDMMIYLSLHCSKHILLRYHHGDDDYRVVGVLVSR